MTQRRHRDARPLTGGIFFALLLLAATAGAAPPDPADVGNWSLVSLSESVAAPGFGSDAEIGLILDDGSREANVGFSGAAAFQFLWFNQFERPPASILDLTEIHVLFPPGPDVVPGAEVQLVVYHDPDSDPTTGAEVLLAFDDVIQVADGATFSIYSIDPPLRLPAIGDVLIGVVNRFVESGVSPPSRPAALDTNASQGRSWVALWNDDPPPSPELPPDLFLDTIDFLEPGNWMIRGFATLVPVVDVPTLDRIGLLALALLVGLSGVTWLHRRSYSSRNATIGSTRLARTAGRRAAK